MHGPMNIKFTLLTVINHDCTFRLKFALITSIPGIHISKYIEYNALKCTVFRVKCSDTFLHKYKYNNKLKEKFLHTYPPMKMEQTECSETLANKIQMPGNYPEESIQQVKRNLQSIKYK